MKKTVILFMLMILSLHANELKLDKVKLQLQWKHQFEFAGFYAAKEKGFYRDVGLDVSFVEFDKNKNITNEVLNGNAQYGLTYSSVIAEYIEGKPLILLANFFKQSPLVLIAQSNIKTPAELKGKKVMGLSNTIDNITLLTMLNKFDIYQNDIDNISASFKIDEFINKKVDAMSVFTTNELYQLDKKGIKYTIFDPVSYGAKYYDANLFTSQKELREYPGRVKLFREASIKGWEYALAHQEELIKIILKKYNSQHKSKEALQFEAKQIEYIMLPKVHKVGSIDINRIQTIAESFIQAGFISTINNRNIENFIYIHMNNPLGLTDKELAFLQTHPKITLGTEKAWKPYVIVNKGGIISGYDADVLKLINKVSGSNFVLEAGDWSQMQTKAKAKEIDGLSTGGIHDERKAYLNFSDIYISMQKMLIVSKENPKNIYTLQDLDNKIIAIHKSNLVDEKIARNFPKSKIIRLDTIEEVITAVTTGKADIMFGNGATFYLANELGLPYLKRVAQLNDTLELAFGVRKDWPEAISIINKSLDYIGAHKLLGLKNKWFWQDKVTHPNISYQKVRLTEDEKQYLKNKKQITMCVDPDWMPFEKIEKGKHIGVSADYIKLLKSKLDISITLVPTTKWSESILLLKEKKCDIVPLAMETPERKKFINFTQPYLTVPLVITTTNDKFFISNFKELEGKTVGIGKSYAQAEFLKIKYPMVNFVEVNTITEGLKKVINGNIFGYIDNLTTIGYQIQNYFPTELKITGQFDEQLVMGIGVRNDEPLLLSIFDKALNTVDTSTKDQILNRWISIKYEQGFDYKLFWKIMSVILIMALGIVYKQITIRNLNIKLKKEVDDKTEDLRNINKNQQLIIQENTQKLQENINTMSNYIIYSRTDLKGIITEASDAFCDMSQYSRDELVGKPHNIIRHPDVKKSIFKDMWKTIKQGQEWRGEVKNLKKDGGYYWVQAEISPEYNKEGKITGYLAIRHDITAKKDLEEQHKTLYEAEKSAKEKAEEATKSKSEFLANMSHEIRTPMNGIIGMSHLALQTDLEPKQKNYLQKIDNSAKLLLGIIDDILDLSKIEAGKLSIEKVDFNLLEVIDHIQELMLFKVKEKNLKFRIMYCTDCTQNFHGDSLRLGQILINLIGNAIKFTNSGTVNLNINRVSQDRYRFVVKDSGIGLTGEQRSKLFQPFSQADGSTTRQYGGSGLGLIISKQLVEFMNGEIWVESEIDVGSTFGFDIDLQELEYLFVDTTMQEDKQTVKVNIKELHGNKILLVEDNSINKEIIVGLLENSGVILDIANNGKEAVDMVKANKYKLIFMDLQMPVMDGYEATKIIKKIDSSIPVIALTANAMLEDISKTKAIGMSEHLNKPIEVAKFYSILLKYLYKQSNAVTFVIDTDVHTHSSLPNFIHIDKDNALKLLLGNEKVFIKILTRFMEYKEIKLENLSDDEFQIIVHTLKGLSASIGAMELNKIVVELDKTGNMYLLPKFDEALKKVCDEIEQKIINTKSNSTERQENKSELSEEKRETLFKHLKEAIETMQPGKCDPILAEIEMYSLNSSDQEIIKKIKTALDAYDFDTVESFIGNI